MARELEEMKAQKKQGGGLGSLLVLVAGGWIAYSWLGIDHRRPLPDAIVAERGATLSKAAGWLNYYVDRTALGRPLVLIHSVNAAASAYEMGPLFRHYSSQRPVFALDLPGYGFSNRLPRNYSPQLFADAIAEFLHSEVGEPADVIALSLGSEFVARAAVAEPELFHSLVLISPSGLNKIEPERAPETYPTRGISDLTHAALSFPLWGRALFDLVASRRSIDYYLRKSFVGPVTLGFADYAYASAHQPGAENAPLHFLSGRLFTRGAATLLYEKVHQPTLVVYDQDPYVDFDGLPALLARNAQWQARRVVPSRGLPHFERLPDVVEVLDAFWAGQGEAEGDAEAEMVAKDEAPAQKRRSSRASKK
jgi:pimeloyl-ACP methyl ester carboxylesterase